MILLWFCSNYQPQVSARGRMEMGRKPFMRICYVNSAPFGILHVFLLSKLSYGVSLCSHKGFFLGFWERMPSFIACGCEQEQTATVRIWP